MKKRTKLKTIEQIEKRFGDFEIPVIDPWTRSEEDGVRLMLSLSGFGLREDAVGRLHYITKTDCVIGRDEARVRRIIRQELKRLSGELAKAMVIDRDLVVGRKRKFVANACSRRHCMITVNADGDCEKPKPFVTYYTNAGTLRFRRILREVSR